MSKGENILPLREAAKEWGVAVITARRLTAGGKIPAFKEGGKLFVRMDAVNPAVIDESKRRGDFHADPTPRHIRIAKLNSRIAKLEGTISGLQRDNLRLTLALEGAERMIKRLTQKEDDAHAGG